MTEKTEKPKSNPAKARKADEGVMSALPANRPERIGGTSRGRAEAGTTSTAAAVDAAPGAAGSRQGAAGKPPATDSGTTSTSAAVEAATRAARNRTAEEGK